MPTNNELQRSRIKIILHEKKCGFIAAPYNSSDQDWYFSYSDIIGHDTPQVGDIVVFESIPGKAIDDKPRAKHIKLIRSTSVSNESTPEIRNVSVSDLSETAYCEQRVVLNFLLGKKQSAYENKRSAEGVSAHREFHHRVSSYRTNPTWTTRSAKSDAPCFIATAVYGQNAWQTNYLRHFRDHHLLKTVIGRILISIYYRLSPPIALWLMHHPIAKSWVRKQLDRIIQRAIK